MKNDKIETPLKSNKLKNLKEIFQKMVAEDPIMAGVFSLSVPPLLGIMAQAILSKDIELVFIIIGTLSGITLFVFIPLIITKTWKYNQKTIGDQRKIAIQAEAVRREEQEKNKQLRFNELMTAKITNIKTHTELIIQYTDKYVRNEIKQTAHKIQENLTALDSAAAAPFQEDLLDVISQLIRRIDKKDQQLDEALSRITHLVEGNALLGTEEDTEDNLSESIDADYMDANTTTDPEEPLITRIPRPESPEPQDDIPPLAPTWSCSSCGRSYKQNIVKCKHCRRSKPT